MDDQLLDFFKTFCDANRLRLAGLLLDQPISAEAAGAKIGIRAMDVAHHLELFEKLGLLRLEGDARTGYRYSLDAKALETLSREVLANRRPVVEARSNDENADDFDKKVVKNYSLPDGSLREIPLGQKKFLPILKHVVTAFEPGKQYTEKEVNEALKRFNADFATLRRGLIDNHLLDRSANGSVYWKNA